MSAYVGAIIACAVFLLVVRAVGLFRKPAAVYGISRQAMQDLRHPELDDDAKERLMRRHALALGWLFLQLTAGGAVALASPLAVLWGLDRIGLLSLDATMTALVSWEFLIGVTAVFGGKVLYDRARRRGT